MTLIEALHLVEGSSTPSAIFSISDYRSISRIIHPDLVPDTLKSRAQAAFAKLTEMRDRRDGKTVAPAPVVVGKWEVGAPVAGGDICDLYHATQSGSAEAILKIARSPDDADLMEQEHFALGYLHTGERLKSYDGNFQKYLPRALDKIDAAGRMANVLEARRGHTLADLCGMFPNQSLDFRHVVWMANRALSALGFIHECGLVHGAIIPEHLLYETESHGLCLLDWCYSVTAESKKYVPALVAARRDYYPPEILRKNQPGPSTDIFMLAHCLRPISRIPRRFVNLFDWCMNSSPSSRPASAWAFQDRFLALAKEEYGEPQFVKLEIPVS